jgi:hypothetical protein
VVEFLLRHVGLPVAGGNGPASIHESRSSP